MIEIMFSIAISFKRDLTSIQHLISKELSKLFRVTINKTTANKKLNTIKTGVYSNISINDEFKISHHFINYI